MTETMTDAPARAEARQAALDATEVRATMLELAAALRAQDLEKLMTFYVDRPDTVAIGSYGQSIVGYDTIRQVFAEEFKKQEPTAMVSMGNITVVSYGNIAWSCATSTRFVKGEDGRTRQQLGRFSAVFEKHGQDWKLAHNHFSMPLEFEQTGQARDAAGE